MASGNIPLPVFTGENFNLWKLKLKTYFIAQKSWDVVKTGYNKPDSNVTLSEVERKKRKKLEDYEQKDAQALFVLQQAVDESITRRIMDADTVKKA